MEQTKSGLIRQMTSEKRFNSYEIFYDKTSKGWPSNIGYYLVEVTLWAGFDCSVTLHSENVMNAILPENQILELKNFKLNGTIARFGPVLHVC